MKNDKAGIELYKAGEATSTVVTANSASVFVVADQDDYNSKFSEIDDWDAYTGIKNAPTVTTLTDAGSAIAGAQVTAYYYCKNSMVTVMFVVPNKLANVEDGAKNAIYFAVESVSDLIHDEDGDYFTYNAIVDGKITTVKVDSDLTGAASLNGLYKSYGTNSKGYITSLKAYDTYRVGNNKEALNEGIGIAKTSKEYTVTLDTYTGPMTDGTTHTGKNATITVDDNAKIYFVDKDGVITDSSYAALYPDDNDFVYAVVEDYLVKTLVVEEVKDADTVVTPTLKPGQKPVTTISGATITVPEIDVAKSTAVQMSDAVNALTDAGYTVTGSLGTGTIMASKDGKSYSFVIVTAQYITLTVDGKVVEYVAANGSFKATADSTTVAKDIAGKGTGYLKNGTYTAYSTTGTTPVIAKTSGTTTAIETGYVTIDATQASSVTGLTSTVTVTTGNVAYNKATVKITAAKADVTKDYTITVMNGSDVVKTFTAKANADIDETVSLGDLTANVAANAITVKADEIKATHSISYPTAVTNNGVTMTVTGPATAKEGETVTAKATFSGTAAGATTFTVGNVTPTWDATLPSGMTASSTTVTIADGTAYLTPVEVLFSFTMGSSDVSITLTK